jgi:predicted MPP superfamily phosphohydrolase
VTARPLGPGAALPVLGAAAAGAAAWSLLEPHLPVLRHVQVPVLPAGACALQVLHVSDLHLLPRHVRRAAWLRRLAGLGPDLVVSTGDHLSSAAAVPLLVRTLGALVRGGVPGVFVPGNNDSFTPVRPSPTGYLRGGPPRPRRPDLPWDGAARALADVGWTDLTHVRQPLELRGTSVLLTGTDDAHLGRDRYGQVQGAVPAGVLGVGVTHTPTRALLDAFARDGYRLLLAGHTHGGQLRLPGVGAMVTNCDLPRTRARGLSRWGEGPQAAWLHVSAGLGQSPYLPVRLGCRPEATLLRLVPESGSLASAGAGCGAAW